MAVDGQIRLVDGVAINVNFTSNARVAQKV